MPSGIYYQKGCYFLYASATQIEGINNPSYNKPVLMKNLKKPARTLMFREALGNSMIFPQASNIPGYSMTDSFMTNTLKWGATEKRQYFDGRHEGKHNLAFYDGHVEARAVEDVANALCKGKNDQYGLYAPDGVYWNR